ncbi:class I SAM-dependent methyltransferase [Streptomyces sp. MP131-18]|uniref:class I SAM-dependent methyltransferase n=1 Tax=Streptomyces sp. MP131-18 TaxID=1857892 RepID=UPI00097C6E43|nr:class I SAM-dependent methyltransferase [Streptomyces sp. MP131-18]ONK10292.1 Methylase of polypeptide chain release factor [Streptomyces sp. MP131-18]
MSGTARSVDAWDGFWRAAPEGRETVFWDAAPGRVAADHLPHFAPHFAEPLPLVDVGCGNGTQTAYLARHHAGPVLGVDLSEEAVARARRAAGPAGPVFRQVDAADPAAAAVLHEELGDCHVYLRGVLHQAPPAEQAALAAGLATLLGARGRGFVVEPSEAAKAELAGLMRRPEGPPPALAAVFEHGISPGALAADELPALFAAAGLSVLASGALPLATTECGADGAPLALPSIWLVIGRRG